MIAGETINKTNANCSNVFVLNEAAAMQVDNIVKTCTNITQTTHNSYIE